MSVQVGTQVSNSGVGIAVAQVLANFFAPGASQQPLPIPSVENTQTCAVQQSITLQPGNNVIPIPTNAGFFLLVTGNSQVVTMIGGVKFAGVYFKGLCAVGGVPDATITVNAASQIVNAQYWIG